MRTGASTASPVELGKILLTQGAGQLDQQRRLGRHAVLSAQQMAQRDWDCSRRVDGVEADTAAFAEWELHVARVLPELAVHDLTQRLADTEERLEAVVHAGRSAGVTWSRMRSVSSRATGGFVRLHG